MKKTAEIFFFLTILLLPTYLIRFTVFSVPLNVLDVLEIVSIVSIFIFLFLKGEKQIILSHIRRKQWAIIGFFCILLGTLISAYSSDGFQAQELGILKSWIVLPFFFVFFGYLCGFSFRKAILWHIGSAGVASVIAFVLPIAIAFTYDDRLRGWYESPNQLAMFIAPALVLLWFLGREKERFRKIFLFGFFVIASALLWAQSLGAIVSVVMAIFFGEMVLFYSYYLGRRVRKERRNLFSFLLGRGDLSIRGLSRDDRGTALGLSEKREPRCLNVCHCEESATWQSRVFYFFKGKNARYWLGVYMLFFGLVLWVGISFLKEMPMSDRSSLSSRVMIWTSALHIARDNPILGIGPGNFQEKYLGYQSFYPPYLEWAVPHSHNIFLTFWLFSGILGLVGFLVVLGSVFFKKSCHCEPNSCHCESAKQSQLANKISVSGLLRRLAMTEEKDLTWRTSEEKNKKTADIFAIAVFCALLSILLHGLVDTTIWGNALSVVFWLIVLSITLRR